MFEVFQVLLQAAKALRHDLGRQPGLHGSCRFGVGELTALTWLPKLVARIRSAHPALVLEPSVHEQALGSLRCSFQCRRDDARPLVQAMEKLSAQAADFSAGAFFLIWRAPVGGQHLANAFVEVPGSRDALYAVTGRSVSGLERQHAGPTGGPVTEGAVHTHIAARSVKYLAIILAR